MTCADSPKPTPDAAPEQPTAFARLGGEAKLRAIIDSFVDAVLSDIMIGFMFQGVHRGRLVELEYQHAAAHLGADVVYRGRPLQQAHAKHRIAGGQFLRRRTLLRESLVAHHVPPELAAGWLAYQDSLRPLITGDPNGVCHASSWPKAP